MKTDSRDGRNIKTRICFFIGGMSRGGAERVISLLANHYAEQGYFVSVILLLTDKVEYDLDDRIEIINLTGKKRAYVINTFYWIKNIRAFVKKTNPDVIVAFVARIAILVQSSCIGLKRNIIISERNDPTMDGRSKYIKVLANLLYPKCNGIVFQTEKAKTCFPKQIQVKGNVIYNPVKVYQFASNENSKKVVAVGRLAAQKNHKLLIDAFKDISKDADYELWIYGEGLLRKELEKYIEECGLSKKIHLPGNVMNIHEVISDSALFVLSSDYEGMSNSLLEALIMGLPVVATNCAGTDEVIVNGENGIIVPTGNKEELSKAMKTILEDADLRKKLANNAKQKAWVFSTDIVLQKWDEVILKNLI